MKDIKEKKKSTGSHIHSEVHRVTCRGPQKGDTIQTRGRKEASGPEGHYSQPDTACTPKPVSFIPDGCNPCCYNSTVITANHRCLHEFIKKKKKKVSGIKLKSSYFLNRSSRCKIHNLPEKPQHVHELGSLVAMCFFICTAECLCSYNMLIIK